MAITIVATPGSATANSFATEAEVIAYMAARLNASAWTTTSGSTCTEDEKKALVEATRELDALAWQGSRVDTTQALSWPRQWCVNPDDPNLDYFDTDVVPQRVKDACCELAFQFLKAGTTDVAALDALTGVKSKTVDVISTTYDNYARPRGLARYPRVLAYVRPLLSSTGGVIRTVRG